MGTAAGFGQSMGGQTGVGSASTQTGQTGGKGGGFGTPTSAQNPYASSQPQTQQTPAQPYQPLGGNAFGYNMARLSRQMDPSATLPTQQPQQFSTQADQAAPTGGKGGGQPGVFGIPQEFEPFAVDMLARSYGYQPYQPSFFQPQTQAVPQTQQQQNPFDQGYSAQQERMSQLERQLADLTARQQTQVQQKDTGEKLADLPKAFEEQNLGIGKTEEQLAEEAANPPPPAPTGYQFGTYTNFKPEDLTGFSKNQVSQLYKQQLTTANADIAEAKKMQKTAKTPAEIRAANDALAAAQGRQTAIKNDLQAALRLVGRSGYQPPVTTQAAATPTPAPATAAATPTPAPATAAATPTPAPATAAASTTASTTPITQAQAISAIRAQGLNTNRDPSGKPWTSQSLANALGQTIKVGNKTFTPQTATAKKGGVIHTGMTSNLKKMLKNK